jgi:alpha-ketoglutarate-dependent sulfate ester dioxygenase
MRRTSHALLSRRWELTGLRWIEAFTAIVRASVAVARSARYSRRARLKANLLKFVVASYKGDGTGTGPGRGGDEAGTRRGRGGGPPDHQANGSYSQRVQDNLLVAIHPVVRVHPETGERALFVNPGFTSHIVDVTARESHAILELLYSEIARPEYTVRFRWEPGSVAFWDNRATAHLALKDYEHLSARRTLHRVTVIGDVPVGPDGRESELIAGRPFTSQHKVVVAG